MRHLSRPLLLTGLFAVLALVVAGCGGGEESSSGGAQSGNKQEQAFLQGMIPHHESAVEMAEVAQEKAKRPEVKKLAASIISDQRREIGQIERIHKRLFGKEIMPDPAAHEKLGLSAEQANMAEMDMAAMEREKPFDRAFIDMMVAHHQGAIRMANAAMKDAKDEEVMQLAANIVEAQTTEIEQMNRWRKKWYGATSPAGGVPKEGETMDGESMEGMGH